MNNEAPILLYDGVCNLCNGTVQFVFRNDKSRAIRFAALQSETAARLLQPFGLSNETMESVILWRNGKVFTHSDAVLELGREMGGLWRPLAFLGYLFPRFIRNAVYRFVARNRYRWFGKKEACMVPTPELRSRCL